MSVETIMTHGNTPSITYRELQHNAWSVETIMTHGNTPGITQDCNNTLGQQRPLHPMVTPQSLPLTIIPLVVSLSQIHGNLYHTCITCVVFYVYYMCITCVLHNVLATHVLYMYFYKCNACVRYIPVLHVSLYTYIGYISVPVLHM